MKLLPICSSSKGNSTYIGTSENGIAVDMGCSYKAFCEGLGAVGADIGSVRAVLITHEHTDHVKGLLTLTKKTHIPIFASEPTLNYLINHCLVASAADLHTVEELSEIKFDASVKSFSTPHDAAFSLGYRFDFIDSSIGFCTDLGYVTDEVSKSLTGCRTVFIEANYQPELLMRNAAYPEYLKRRIAGENGHLSNNDSADFCGKLVNSGTVSIVLGHLSQENNTPETAFNKVRDRLGSLGAAFEKDYMLKVAPVQNLAGDYVVF